MNIATTDNSAKAAETGQQRTTAAPSAPLLVPIREARRQLGSIGTTAFYAAVKRHEIKLFKIGGRSVVAMTEIERVVGEIVAERPADASDKATAKAKALAKRSVKARKARRGSTPTLAPPPSAPRRRKRGSTAA